MSIFASRTQKVVAIPFDEPHTVTIQKLSGRQIEKAREATQMEAVEALQRLGGAEFQKQLGAIGDATKTADVIAKAQADPLNTYDRFVVLCKGIKAWTYDVPVTPEHLEDLSAEAADFLAREILALTLPSRGEAAQKNGSGSSTAD